MNEFLVLFACIGVPTQVGCLQGNGGEWRFLKVPESVCIFR